MSLQHFNKLKSNLEPSTSLQKAVSQHHNSVRKFIENQYPHIKTQLIGSQQRLTRVHPRPNELCDIDILVTLDKVVSWVPANQGTSPEQAIQFTHTVLEGSKRYAGMEPTPENRVVTLEYEGNVNVELIPAFLDHVNSFPDGTPRMASQRAYWIPNKKGGWELADYNYDADYITKTNKQCDGILIPTIKVLKAVKREHFPEMKSFHLEVILTNMILSVVELFKKYDTPITIPHLMKVFFSLAPSSFEKENSLPGSLSTPITIAPDKAASLKSKFSVIAEYCNLIDTEPNIGNKIEMWRKLLGEAFPLTI